jgi:hypothetical protein
MLRGLFRGLVLAIIILGGAWLFLSYRAAEHSRIEYYPYPVPDSSLQSEVNRLSSENSALVRQNSLLKNDLNICQNRDIYYTCDCPDCDDWDDSWDDWDDDEWDLTVRVRDEDGDPIEDARVRIENGDSESENTDEDGEAEFNNIEEDCYDIEVSAEGYEDETDEICVEDDERVNIRMSSE